MFEALTARVARAAERRARERARRVAGAIAEDAPAGVDVDATPDGVVLTGRRAALHWIVAGLKR